MLGMIFPANHFTGAKTRVKPNKTVAKLHCKNLSNN